MKLKIVLVGDTPVVTKDDFTEKKTWTWDTRCQQEFFKSVGGDQDKNCVTVNLTVDGTAHEIDVWQTEGGGRGGDVGINVGIDNMRPLSYPQTDVFLCCYDMRNSRGEELTETYVPEIQAHMGVQGALFWTVGTLGDEEHELALDLKCKEMGPKPTSRSTSAPVGSAEHRIQLEREEDLALERRLLTSAAGVVLTSAAAAANDPPNFAGGAFSSFYMGHVSGCVRTKEGEGENSPRSVLQSVVRKHVLREEEKAAAANTCPCVLQ